MKTEYFSCPKSFSCLMGHEKIVILKKLPQKNKYEAAPLILVEMTGCSSLRKLIPICSRDDRT